MRGSDVRVRDLKMVSHSVEDEGWSVCLEHRELEFRDKHQKVLIRKGLRPLLELAHCKDSIALLL